MSFQSFSPLRQQNEAGNKEAQTLQKNLFHVAASMSVNCGPLYPLALGVVLRLIANVDYVFVMVPFLYCTES
jgi:hypothetical protein